MTRAQVFFELVECLLCLNRTYKSRAALPSMTAHDGDAVLRKMFALFRLTGESLAQPKAHDVCHFKVDVKLFNGDISDGSTCRCL